MSAVVVKTQAALDKALAAKAPLIYIESPSGAWLKITDSGSSSVEAWGSSSVEAWGSSSVEAWGSSSVVARGSSSVEAWGSSSVEAWGSSRVVAWGSSSVEAWGSSSVEASKFTSVHLWSQRVTLDSAGAVIDCTAIDLEDREQWAEYHGGKTADGKLTVYRAVDDELMAGHSYTPTSYSIGETITAPDWRDDKQCGHGLHFGISVSHAVSYYANATRFLACQVDATTFIPLGDKIKAESCVVLYEVDRHGDRLEVEATA